MASLPDNRPTPFTSTQDRYQLACDQLVRWLEASGWVRDRRRECWEWRSEGPKGEHITITFADQWALNQLRYDGGPWVVVEGVQKYFAKAGLPVPPGIT